jgi:hypothetical protein
LKIQRRRYSGPQCSRIHRPEPDSCRSTVRTNMATTSRTA